jgi:hypothetical protein
MILQVLLIPFLCYAGVTSTVPPLQEPTGRHPFYVTVTQVTDNAKEKILEITCKLFTDDFEKQLRKNYNGRVDLLGESNKETMEKLVSVYITGHLQVAADGKACALQFVGFEKDEEAVDCYFQVNNIVVDKMISVTDNILFDYKPEEVNIVHVTVRGTRKSTQLINPDSRASFTFP